MKDLKLLAHKQAFSLAFLLISITGVGQVYNYTPPTAFNFETNPAILANKKYNNRIVVRHHNTFSKNSPFNHTSVRYSKFLASKFIGLGVSLNRTSYGQHIGYYHAGLAIGYRNVLFNKLIIKLGAMYKVNQFNAPPSNLYYLRAFSMGGSSNKHITQNINWSVMLGNSDNSRYVSFSNLNMNVPGMAEESDFLSAEYYNWTVGNLLSFGRNKEQSLSYNGFIRKMGSFFSVSHYVNFKFNARLGRKHGLNFGGRIGKINTAYHHIAPMLQLYNKNYAIQAFYNIHLTKRTFTFNLPPSIQFSLTHKL